MIKCCGAYRCYIPIKGYIYTGIYIYSFCSGPENFRIV